MSPETKKSALDSLTSRNKTVKTSALAAASSKSVKSGGSGTSGGSAKSGGSGASGGSVKSGASGASNSSGGSAKSGASGKSSRKGRRRTGRFSLRSFFPHSPSGKSDSLSMEGDDPVERAYFRRSLILLGGAFLVMLFFFTAAFFLAVRGAERTVVPQIVNRELIDALQMLQERELYPRVQAKFTGNPSDKGLIISQDPEPGLYVKAGRRVTVTVSRGAVMDNVEDYTGMSVTEVRGRLASLFSTFEPLLVIREPVTYVYNNAEAGTILHQTPKAGTPLDKQQELILIASRGKLNRPIVLPNLKDYSADNAMRALARIPLAFVFVEDNSVEPAGYSARVTTQSPAAEAQVGSDMKVVLRYRRPKAWGEDSRYGLFDHTFPDTPVPVALEVIIREPGAEDRTLFSMPHSGGRLSFPYVLPLGSSIVVEINGEEAVRQEVVSQ